MWKLDNGLKVVRAIQQNCRSYGYHLTIGGGVVNNGSSEKDLDLYFLPMGGFNKDKKNDADGMLKFLATLWGYPEKLSKGGDNEEYKDMDEGCYAHAVKFTTNNKRIDCFIFKGTEDK